MSHWFPEPSNAAVSSDRGGNCHGTLSTFIAQSPSPASFLSYAKEYFKFADWAIKERVREDPQLLTGFVHSFASFVLCLSRNTLPNPANVATFAPEHVQRYLRIEIRTAGKVFAGSYIFDTAMNAD